MQGGRDITGMIETVQGLLHAKFGVRTGPLPRMLKRTGRRLPRRMHARAQALLKAEQLAGNPRLARQMDMTSLRQGFEALTAHLEAIDPVARRKDRLLKLAALLAFQVLLIGGVFVWWLWWSGHV